MLIVTGLVREFVRRMRILVAGLLSLSLVLVDLQMSNKFLTLLAEALAPVDRIAASQPVDYVPGQCRRHFALAAISEDCDTYAKLRDKPMSSTANGSGV
jgi:hypothetical protein